MRICSIKKENAKFLQVADFTDENISVLHIADKTTNDRAISQIGKSSGSELAHWVLVSLSSFILYTLIIVLSTSLHQILQFCF